MIEEIRKAVESWDGDALVTIEQGESLVQHLHAALANPYAEVRADERARIAREMGEYISRDEPTGFAQGWNRAIEVVSARIESEVSSR